ncbi:MAG: Eco57I restriction-modification methylase domain-containing protein [Nitrospira sp.]
MSVSKESIDNLIDKFAADESRLISNSTGYTETEVRVEYIDPLFACLGWDMANAQGIPNSMKDVVREESQVSETSSKRPDYTFRIAAIRKFFIEAKKPSVDIKTHKDSSFQIRSYGWTAGMSVSILTNFRTLRVYDTKTAPVEADDANVGLILEIDYKDLPNRFDELINLFGRDAVATGSIEARFGTPAIGTLPINFVFLEHINSWRLRLATDIHTRYPALNLNSLNDLVQKIINRIIFIRMCEDRGIEGAEQLRKIAQRKSFIELRVLFRKMDARYNTGLFDAANDPFQAEYTIDTQLFLEIVEEVYFPKAPYSFSVLNADFLGQVYELFLVKKIAFDQENRITLREKSAYEGREVISTPQPLVDEIARRTFSGRLIALRESGKFSYDALKQLKILDLAVGSGRFLLRSLDELVDATIEYYRLRDDTKNIYRRSEGDYRLTFERKRELLQLCLFGIDIDYNAVEVARFSLLVKLLEDESQITLPATDKILPNLDQNILWGNSVVDADFNHTGQSVIDLVCPLDWSVTKLPPHFDIVVSNPPYVKTEEMKGKIPNELEYYKEKYNTPYKQFDKYFVFIERAISKMGVDAWIGMVVPNKWITIEAGRNLRELLASHGLVAEIVDFGNELLFEGKSTYVCLLVLSNTERPSFQYRHVNNYQNWLTSPSERRVLLPSTMLQNFGANPWVLPANELEAEVLLKLYTNSIRLGDIATVINGIQTSAEDIFSIENWIEENGVLHFDRGGQSWQVEKVITKPYLMDSTSRVWSYLPIVPDARVIFPYEYGSTGKAVLIPPDRFSVEYPLAWKYLNSFHQRLNERDVSPPSGPGEFYSYGRHQALSSAFEQPKIIYTVNQIGDKYGIDLTGVGFASGGTAGEVAITKPNSGYSLEFILGLLN